MVVSGLVEVDFTAKPQLGLFPEVVIMREFPVKVRHCRISGALAASRLGWGCCPATCP